MLKEKLKMMNGVLENGNYQLGQFKFGELRKSQVVRVIMIKFLNDIRNVEKPISNNRKIINTIDVYKRQTLQYAMVKQSNVKIAHRKYIG